MKLQNKINPTGQRTITSWKIPETAMNYKMAQVWYLGQASVPNRILDKATTDSDRRRILTNLETMGSDLSYRVYTMKIKFP